MNDPNFLYALDERILVFKHTLDYSNPYTATVPRNHESLFFVLNGNLVYEKQGKREIVKKGDVGYIERGSLDTSGAADLSGVTYIGVNFGFDEGAAPLLGLDTLCTKGFFSGYEELFKRLLKVYNAKMAGYLTVTKGILLQIIGMLYGEGSLTEKDIGKTKKIQKGIELIQKRFSDPDFKISEAAAASGLGTKQFRRLFFEAHGENPYAYLSGFRLEQGRLLLLNSSYGISDIAEMCGFSDVYGFSHSFKARFGLSPAKWRESSV